jgi:hypothetical protein
LKVESKPMANTHTPIPLCSSSLPHVSSGQGHD